LLWDIEETSNALHLQLPPNDGVLNPVASPLGIDVGTIGFDIETLPNGVNRAWLIDANTLYQVGLVSGLAQDGRLVIGLSVQDTTLGTTVANLGMAETKFPKPVFAGDTIRAETRVLEVRASKSRPDQGIVIFEHMGRNQHDEIVCTTVRSALIRRRPA